MTEKQLDDEPAEEELSGHFTRRHFLKTGAVGAGALVGAVVAGTNAVTTATTSASVLQSFPDGASKVPAVKAQAASFEGGHQLAVLSEPTEATAIVSFDVIAESPSELRDLLRTITDRMRLLYGGGTPADLGPAAPTDDNGILGPVVPSQRIAFVLGMGASLFDDRYGLVEKKPHGLSPMQSFPNDNLNLDECHGDLSIQFCAGGMDTVLHGLRDLTKHTRGGMQARWRLDGFKSPPRPSGTPRNLLGFKDGIANPNMADRTEIEKLVWVPRSRAAPTWTTGGTFQVVRIIRMLTEFWDRVSLYEQENMIGRRRASGAPLDANDEFAIPKYKDDPQGLVIPLTAHIRLANPRTVETDQNRILRRGYNYDRGLDANGNLDMGLLFTCYQQDIERQFVVNQTRLINEPLVDYVSPVGGGYFFCPPGLEGRNDYFGSGFFT